MQGPARNDAPDGAPRPFRASADPPRRGGRPWDGVHNT
jgi:hypothetical protein